MSKKLIAGAGVVASFAIALAPLATFATHDANYSDAHTDRFVLTLNPSCTFGSTTDRGGVVGVAHTDSTWNITTGAGYEEHDLASDGSGVTYHPAVEDPEPAEAYYDGNHSINTFTATLDTGTTNTGLATTTLKVVCNSNSGYTIEAAAGDLEITESGRSEKIEASSAELSTTASSYKGTMALEGTSGTGYATTARLLNSGAIVTETATPVAENTGSSVEAGDTWKVTYGIGIATSQRAGTYVGDVVYTLYQGV